MLHDLAAGESENSLGPGTDLKSVPFACFQVDRDGSQVHSRRESAVQLDLTPAGEVAPSPCREVEEAEVDGLLDLVHPVAREEDP